MSLSTSASTNRNGSVDAFRLLAAFCVILLHLEYPALPGNLVSGVRLLCRWAIPFFFIVSGYYFASQHAAAKELNIQKLVGRLIWIFLLWSIIYLPVVLNQHDFKTAFQRLFSPNFVYFGSFVHLWFISSLIFGYILIAFLYQFKMEYTLPVFAVIILVLTLLSTPYPIFGNEYSFAYVNHLLSVPFLYIGFQFYKKGFPPVWICLILIITGVVMQIVEVRFIYRAYGLSAYDHEFLIGTIPFAIGMTALAFNNLKGLQWPMLNDWGRDNSLGIYLIHPLVIHVVTRFLPQFPENMLWQVVFPIIILGLCILLLEIVRRFLPAFFNFLYGKHIKTQPSA
jgi:surface polysaccharide O-acyltransferase-like enzyme